MFYTVNVSNDNNDQPLNKDPAAFSAGPSQMGRMDTVSSQGRPLPGTHR